MAVDRCDVVAGLETGIGGGIGDRRSVGELNDGVDGADAGGVELGEGGFADEPDDTSEGEGEEDIERGAGDEDQHLRRVVDGWEAGDVGGAFALDGAEVGELREEDVAPEGDPGEPVFDAANILRSNNDILYLVSNTGNKLGAKWLQNLLGDQYKVHILENMYSYSHLDSTIALLREGLCLLNPERVNESNMPEMLKSWDKIWSPPMVDIGYHKVERASLWVGINLLSIDENTVIVDNRQTELIKELKKHKIDALDCKIRHSRTLGGSFHCVTTETLRD